MKILFDFIHDIEAYRPYVTGGGRSDGRGWPPSIGQGLRGLHDAAKNAS